MTSTYDSAESIATPPPESDLEMFLCGPKETCQIESNWTNTGQTGPTISARVHDQEVMPKTDVHHLAITDMKAKALNAVSPFVACALGFLQKTSFTVEHDASDSISTFILFMDKFVTR